MNKLLLIASIIGASAVAIGAFGAHWLKDILLENDRIATFETASQYHFYHALALLFIGLFPEKENSLIRKAALSFLLGITIFSGSLYILSITNITILGAITPIGGVLLIVGWIFLAIFAFRSK